MAVKAVKTVYWTCDAAGCQAKGEGHTLPEDWRYIQGFKPHNKPGEENRRELSALVCPKCWEWFKAAFQQFAKKEVTQGGLPEDG